MTPHTPDLTIALLHNRVHLEVAVADVPAYDAAMRVVRTPYAQIAAEPTLLNPSSREEILADKVVAFPAYNKVGQALRRMNKCQSNSP